MKTMLRATKWSSAAILLFVGSEALAAECSAPSVTGLQVAAVSVKSTKLVTATGGKPAHCDVTGAVRTDGEGAGAGSASFMIVLPERWNQKLLFGGGRGTGGNLGNSANLPDIDRALAKGYAIVTTDLGHAGSDDKWYAGARPGEGDLPKLVDFHYRATHQVTVAAKALTERYYGGKLTRAYFDGCSNGGRQAITEAVRYPDDFDGIIAGCPWLDFAGSAMLNIQRTRAFLEPNRHIPLSKFAAIDAAVVANCDERDGVKDGMIQNPMNCAFDPHSLVPALLTKPQADGLDTYLNAVRDDRGNMISAGSSVARLSLQFNGVRNNPDGTPLRAVVYEQPAPFPHANYPWGEGKNESHTYNSARAVVTELGFNDPQFDLTNGLYHPNGAANSVKVKELYERLGPGIVADPAKLKAYLAKGGKLLIYHGLNDMTISGYGTILYYRELARERGGFDKLSKQVRLFLVPGMQHCNDGPEPVLFNTLDAIESWVEEDKAPQTLLASYTVDAGKTPVRTMPLCTFPIQARYSGKGDVKDAANWSCPANDTGMLKIARNGVQAGLAVDLDRYTNRYRLFPTPRGKQ